MKKSKYPVLAGVLTAALMAAAPAAFANDAAAGSAPAAAEHKEKDGGPKIDTDKDGKVSKAEFMTAQEERFAKTDKDSDGFITQDEFKASREEHKKNWEAKREKMKEMKKEMHGGEDHPE